ncbi:MAG: hypothetical protein RML38_10315 [Bacteroidia bacterium]|nr:hypothetical protein [Bacteroidia bacterium]
MKLRGILAITGLMFLFAVISCTKSSNKTKNPQDTANKTADTIKKQQSDINVDELVAKIDKKRAEIESLNLKPVEITTSNLREKIKQKWSKIHYYVQEGRVVRIKTYAYPNISKRTEEFYLDDSNLILAVIEDDGQGPKGKSKEKLDKMYYYHNGKMIKEIKSSTEPEFSINQSDAAELLSECNEYLEIFKQTKQTKN